MSSNVTGEFELIRRYFTRPSGVATSATKAVVATTVSTAPATAIPTTPTTPKTPTTATTASTVVLGIGDDCALIAPTPGHELAFSTDMLVEGRHFIAGTDPERLGHKTLAVNLSDCAAIGARPRYALLAGALPDADPAWLSGFSRGLFALADRFDVELIGGDTTRGPRNLCMTIIGEVPSGQALLRSGARVGDVVWVSGELGSAAVGLALLQKTLPDGAADALTATDRTQAIDALERPEPRVPLGLALRGIATSAIDVSDGLIGDLGHVLERSGVGADIDLARVPCQPWLRSMASALASRASRDFAMRAMLAGGDDYELCFTAPSSREGDVHAAAREARVAVTAIGRIVLGTGLTVRDQSGAVLPLENVRAFDHFQ